MDEAKEKALGAFNAAKGMFAANGMVCNIAMGVGMTILIAAVIVLIVTMGKFSKNKNKFVEPEVTTVAMPKRNTKQLRNYHIKAAHNACASGEFANDWVDLEALENAINNGCRWLHMEIYDIGGEPAVAVSNSVKYTSKSCYNSLPLGDVFKTIKDKAYTTSNGRDPLFLSLQVKSDNAAILPKIAELLRNYFAERLLGNAFSYEFSGRNLGAVPLSMLTGKVIVVGDLMNPKVKESGLMEYVNLGGNSAFNRVLQFTEAAYNPPSDLLEFAQKNITVCVPDLTSSASNYDSAVAFNQGIQVVAMCFQTPDANLALYNAKFGKYAFVEKSEGSQYKPTMVAEAPPLPPNVNYKAAVDTVMVAGIPQEISIG